jgi:hypothetical protein
MASVVNGNTMFIKEIEDRHRQASGKWTGCDWPTRFGITGVNLNGLWASQALLLARATSGRERSDWYAAADWLTRIEQDAREAEQEAGRAVALSRSGKLQDALARAKIACIVEAKHHASLVWQPLREAIETTLAASNVETTSDTGVQKFNAKEGESCSC